MSKPLLLIFLVDLSGFPFDRLAQKINNRYRLNIYNEQVGNLNINTRFQWRLKPASDLFLVYTDNYIPFPINERIGHW